MHLGTLMRFIEHFQMAFKLGSEHIGTLEFDDDMLDNPEDPDHLANPPAAAVVSNTLSAKVSPDGQGQVIQGSNNTLLGMYEQRGNSRDSVSRSHHF